MQGAYRLLGRDEGLIESFVSAPGPMGWRYFAHVHPAGDPHRDLSTVDLVTDLDWNLVRFRWVDAAGGGAVATRTAGGVEVAHGPPDSERIDRFEVAPVVWSRSPASLLVIHRLIGSKGGKVRAVGIESGAEPVLLDVSLTVLDITRVATAGGESEAERVRVVANALEFEALIRADLPLHADGWFDLIA